MPEDIKTLTTMQKIAQAGERIYQEKYKESFEKDHAGNFVVIDITSAHAYLGNSPEAAMQKGREAAPNGIFHLIRVGSPGAFKISRVGHAHAGNWPF